MKMFDAKLRDLSVKDGVQRPKLGVVIREYKEELKRVSWTTKDELKLLTKVVIGTTFVFGLGIYIVDLVIKGFLHLIGQLVH
ncbi:MAG: preprotein translocase subunit SecE [Chlamydiales bacterium]